jgi:hypothetical protein
MTRTTLSGGAAETKYSADLVKNDLVTSRLSSLVVSFTVYRLLFLFAAVVVVVVVILMTIASTWK